MLKVLGILLELVMVQEILEQYLNIRIFYIHKKYKYYEP
jgi:hypothetical protein